MNHEHNFENLTIKEIFEKILGREVAAELLRRINDGINKGLKGDDLKEYIYRVLCELSITNVEAIEMAHSLPQIITRFVIN